MGSGLAGRPGLHPRRSVLGGGQGTSARVGVTKQVSADRGSIVSSPRFGLYTNREPDPFLQRRVSSRGPWSCRRDKVEAPITVNRTTGTPTGETAPVTNGPRPRLNGISGGSNQGSRYRVVRGSPRPSSGRSVAPRRHARRPPEGCSLDRSTHSNNRQLACCVGDTGKLRRLNFANGRLVNYAHAKERYARD